MKMESLSVSNRFGWLVVFLRDQSGSCRVIGFVVDVRKEDQFI